jgi:hypothetical protein
LVLCFSAAAAIAAGRSASTRRRIGVDNFIRAASQS